MIIIVDADAKPGAAIFLLLALVVSSLFYSLVLRFSFL